MPNVNTQSLIISYLLQHPTGIFTAQEIATGINVHRTTVQRALQNNHMPGVVKAEAMRYTGTRTAEQYYYDQNAAQLAIEQYRANKVAANTVTVKEEPVRNNSLKTTVLDVSGIEPEARKAIEGTLVKPALSVNEIKERLTKAIEYMDSDENQSDIKQLIWLELISGGVLQLAIDLEL